MKLRAFLSISVATAILSLSGCVGVAFVPSFSKKLIGGKQITKRDADFIVPGRTTRAEVIQKIGTQNCRESLQIAAMAYQWEMPKGHFFWFAAGYMAAAGGDWKVTRWRALFLAFDSRGVVTRKEFVKLNQERPLDVQLERWAGLGVSNMSPP